MNEDAQRIFDYLPISYLNPFDQEYIDFLWDAFEANYSEKPANSDNKASSEFKMPKYNFSFLAYHMLFMCFVYFEIWQIKNTQKDDFEKALVGFDKKEEAALIKAASPFAFKDIKESVVFRFLKLIGLNNSDIGKCTDLVKHRNNTSHSSGSISFKDRRSLDLKINDVLRCVEIIQNHSGKIVRLCYEKFLLESANPETREHFEDEDQVREVLVYGNYLSIKDIDVIRDYEYEHLKDKDRYENIVSLAKKLKEMYPSES